MKTFLAYDGELRHLWVIPAATVEDALDAVTTAKIAADPRHEGSDGDEFVLWEVPAESLKGAVDITDTLGLGG